jgi:hypothetical protein
MFKSTDRSKHSSSEMVSALTNLPLLTEVTLLLPSLSLGIGRILLPTAAGWWGTECAGRPSKELV